mgnify:CR=1 FL=1
MGKILLSINPEHVKNILTRKKQYEFRKIRCKKDIDKIVIYATAPISKIVGEVDVIDIVEDYPEKVWEITECLSGITKDFFEQYYKNSDKAVDYKLGDVTKYKQPKYLKDFGINFAPQSFIYL